ncbi:hypothetical protein ABPG74_001742 [Tetrahymena malaccensis]
MQGTFFRGTTHNQDARFSDKEKKLMQTMNFDEILDKIVDLKNVDLEILEPWVDQQVTKILGIEDEVIPAMIINELDSYKKDEKPPNGKLIQIRVTGFLERDTKRFMADLWKLLLEAQNSPHGIPTSLIDSKKQELKDKEELFKKSQEQLLKLEEAKKKLEQDEKKLKELSRLFTDKSSSVERKPNIQQQQQQQQQDKNSIKDTKSNDKRHRESLKKFEEDELLEKTDKKEVEKKKNNKRSSSSSRSRSKKDNKRKEQSHKSRKHRDSSSSDQENKYKEKSQRDNKHKSSKNKRDRSRS